MVYNTTDNKIYYCNGSNYQGLTGITSNFFSLDGYSIVSQGKLKFSGIAEGKDKVVTSVDAFGNAEWKTPSSGGKSGAGGFSVIGTSPATSNGQTFTGGTSTKVAIFNVEEFDDSLQFNNNTFTAKVAGVYHFDLKMSIFPVTVPIPEATIANIQIKKNGTNIRVSTQAIVQGGVEFVGFFNLKLSSNDSTETSSGGYFKAEIGGCN